MSEDPIGEILRALASEGGVPVPPELRARLEQDPELKKLIEQGRKSGDMTAAQTALQRTLLAVVNENVDSLNGEELKQLLTACDAGGGQLPREVGELKRVLAQASARAGAGNAAAGAQGSGAGADGGTGTVRDSGTGTGKTDGTPGAREAGSADAGTAPVPLPLQTRIDNLAPPTRRLVRGLLRAVKGPVEIDGPVLDAILAEVGAAGAVDDARVSAVLAQVSATPAATRDQLIASLHEALATASAKPALGSEPATGATDGGETAAQDERTIVQQRLRGLSLKAGQQILDGDLSTLKQGERYEWLWVKQDKDGPVGAILRFTVTGLRRQDGSWPVQLDAYNVYAGQGAATVRHEARPDSIVQLRE